MVMSATAMHQQWNRPKTLCLYEAYRVDQGADLQVLLPCMVHWIFDTTYGRRPVVGSQPWRFLSG